MATGTLPQTIPDIRVASRPGFTGRNAPLLISIAIATVMVVLFTWKARWPGITLSIPITDVMTKMAPLMLAAAFIERAVEVIISPWRDAGATTLENKLNALKAQTPAANAMDIQAADAEFQAYTGKTQQYAGGVALTLGLGAAYAGVRAFWPFVNTADFYAHVGSGQRWMFVVVDVVISAALLAGGADGIHQVVNAFTTFFSTTAQKATQAAAAPPKQ